MIRLRIVGDGERDAATLGPLVKGILRADFAPEASPWPRLHRGEKKPRGYSLAGAALKLYYLLIEARDRQYNGVVATVDADKDRTSDKLRQLKLARDADRATRPPLPAALGEAIPHNEAWLLDDPVAVRQGLHLVQDASIPNVRDCRYPKSTLEQLHQQSPRADKGPLEVWPDIAAAVRVDRCNHREETGLAAFVDEIRSELGPLFAAAG